MATRAFRRPRSAGLAAILLALVGAPGSAEELDTQLYARILGEYTAEVTDPARVRVDYRRLGEAPEWRRLIANLSEVEPERLAGRPERLAFWINTYNILAVDVVVRHYPVESIRDIGSLLRPVWNREAGTIGGRAYSLGEIEHEILRPVGEPRIHAAIVCASTSCPSLRREPYEAARLETQLDDALRRWLADPAKGARLDRQTDVLYLSRIFEWFDEDFEAGGGVIAYLDSYLPADIRAFVRARGDSLRIRYLDYDWKLNDLAPPSEKPHEAGRPRLQGRTT